jgi:hypothetical protein
MGTYGSTFCYNVCIYDFVENHSTLHCSLLTITGSNKIEGTLPTTLGLLNNLRVLLLRKFVYSVIHIIFLLLSFCRKTKRIRKSSFLGFFFNFHVIFLLLLLLLLFHTSSQNKVTKHFFFFVCLVLSKLIYNNYYRSQRYGRNVANPIRKSCHIEGAGTS